MGIIGSKDRDIDDKCFTQLATGRAYKAVKVVRIKDETAIVELANGQFSVIGRTGMQVNTNGCFVGFGIHTFTKTVLDGLVKLGCLTRKQVDDHFTTIEAVLAKRKRERAIRDLETACADLGISMPKVDGHE